MPDRPLDLVTGWVGVVAASAAIAALVVQLLV
jgi:hypothetical protein